MFDVTIIRHFHNNGIEYGYYLVDKTLVVKNGDEYKAIPFFRNTPIKECVVDVTDKVIDAIKQKVEQERALHSEEER